MSLLFPDPRPGLGYADCRLDRQSGHREEADWVGALEHAREARRALIVGERVVARIGQPFSETLFDRATVETLVARCGLAARESAFLGTDAAGIGHFATLYDGDLDARPLPEGFAGPDLRTMAVQGFVDAPALGYLAAAKALFNWHARHRFCANCGAATTVASAGWRRDCAGCRAQHFPRTDPVVIMLAVDGENCLLGRQARFVANSFSCLAGFLEPGETIEAAVRREIKEEADIDTGRVDYLFSQPWPFPSSLMIGCIAEATSTAIAIDPDELEQARWFSRSEARTMLDRTHPDGLITPPPFAIANHILRTWVDGAWKP